MSVKTYLVRFTPLGRFYFGSSQSFAESFNAVSRRYPTPMTILGCLRRTVLYQHGLLDDTGRFPKDHDGKKYTDFTGSSDGTNLFEENPQLGKMDSFSSVFVVKEIKDRSINDYLFPVPHDVIQKNGRGEMVVFSGGCRVKRNGEDVEMAVSDAYKDLFLDALGGEEFWTQYLNGSLAFDGEVFYPKVNAEDKKKQSSSENNPVFIADTKPGIARYRKDEDVYKARSSKDGAFYIEESYYMMPGYSFGILLRCEEQLLQDDFVILGGNRSMFKMTITEYESVKQNHPLMNLLSQALVSGNASMGNSAGTKTVMISPYLQSGATPLRLTHGRVFGRDFYRSLLFNQKDSVRKSDSVVMYPAGSVVYGSNLATESVGDGKSITLAHRIGFNTLVTI